MKPVPRNLWPCICAIALCAAIPSRAQLPVISISTAGNTAPAVTYTGVKGAGLRQANNTLRSSWDSSGTSFTVKFNSASVNNIQSVTQYSVAGVTSTIIKAPANAVVKLRRLGNSYVNDTRDHYNFWATYSSVPAAGATSGTYNFTAPEVISPEDAFMLNNITSGYDNIFENTISNLHASNIERVDYIIPGGMTIQVAADLLNSGVAVFDRGTGDPFKIAAITALNANGDPSAFGPLVPVTVAQFGGNLLPSSFDFCIITRDPKYRDQSRPSSPDRQNIRGVYISLGALGVTVNQPFYGYAMFADDVTVADPDWRKYPSNTSTASGLDPVNVTGLYKTPLALLAVPMDFTAARAGRQAKLAFVNYNKTVNDHVIVERSKDGSSFEPIARLTVSHQGRHDFTDPDPGEGNVFYRLKLTEKDGTTGYTETRRLEFPRNQEIQVYPNPALADVCVRIPAVWQQRKVMLLLVDAAGRTVQQQVIERASHEISWPLKPHPGGHYRIQVINMHDHSVITKSLVLGHRF